MSTTKISGHTRLKSPGCHMCDSGLPLDADGVHEDCFGEKATCAKLTGQGVYMLLTSPSGATGEHPAILLIGSDGKPPVAFTEEEVKAFVKEMFAARFDPGRFTPRHREEKVIGQPFEETIPQWIERAKAIVAAKHGITLP